MASSSDKIAAAQAFLYQALQATIGIALRVSDMARARALLYEARTLAEDPALARLTFRVNPLAAQSELHILRGVTAKHVGRPAGPVTTLDDIGLAEDTSET